MNRHVKLLILFSLFSFQSLATSENRFEGFLKNFNKGDHTGNGGDVVECTVEGKKTYRILDFYEVTELHFLEPKMEPNLTRDEYLQTFMERMSQDRSMSKYIRSYKDRVAGFFKRISWVNRELRDIPDSNHTYIPPECRIIQIAINHFNGRISIRKDLWDKLDHLNQAVLILHELLYEDAILSGMMDSVIPRLYLSHLIADSAKISFQMEMVRINNRQTLGEYQKIVNHSPFQLLKSQALSEALKQYDINLSFEVTLIALAQSSLSFMFYDALRSFYSENWLKKNSDFVKKYIYKNLEYFERGKQVLPSHLEKVFLLTDHTRGFSLDLRSSFDQIVHIYSKLNHQEQAYRCGTICEFMSKNSNLIRDKKSLHLILSKYKTKVFTNQILSNLPLYLTIPKHFADQYYRDIVHQHRHYLQSQGEYTFFLKRNLYVDEVSSLLKKFLLDPASNLADINRAFSWFVNENQSDLYLYRNAELFFEELKIAALYNPSSRIYSSNPYLRIMTFYERFRIPVLNTHLVNILKSATTNYQVQALKWLIKEQSILTDQVQDKLSYIIRFHQMSEYFKAKLVLLLSRFERFSEFTLSIIGLEIRRHYSDRSIVLAFLNLFRKRTYTPELESVFKYLLNHPDPEIVELVQEILAQN